MLQIEFCKVRYQRHARNWIGSHSPLFILLEFGLDYILHYLFLLVIVYNHAPPIHHGVRMCLFLWIAHIHVCKKKYQL